MHSTLVGQSPPYEPIRCRLHRSVYGGIAQIECRGYDEYNLLAIVANKLTLSSECEGSYHMIGWLTVEGFRSLKRALNSHTVWEQLCYDISTVHCVGVEEGGILIGVVGGKRKGRIEKVKVIDTDRGLNIRFMPSESDTK